MLLPSQQNKKQSQSHVHKINKPSDHLRTSRRLCASSQDCHDSTWKCTVRKLGQSIMENAANTASIR